VLAPFRVRNFRFQWPADLSASWAFEMEALILAWYVFVETKSVLLLTLFGSLLWLGTLIAPFFGVLGDRLGHRNVLCAMRAFYVAQAVVLMTLAFTGSLAPLHVFIISALMSLVRSSDQVMRYALVGAIMPAQHLMGAMSIERMTSDSARVVGALTGAGLIATLGMGPAYLVITVFYASSLLLTLCVTSIRGPAVAAPAAARHVPRASPWRDLVEAFGYVRRTPVLLATMWLAFLVNLTAYPLTLGLLPYVAKDIYLTDQTGLGYLVASFAFGALIGSLGLTHWAGSIRAGRFMVVFACLWYLLLAVFAQMPSLALGITALLFAGCAQSLSLVPMSAILLRHSEERYRGRVVGIRMFAIYGLPIGLMAAGPLIEAIGYRAMATGYCLFGMALTCCVASVWREYVWLRNSPTNAR